MEKDPMAIFNRIVKQFGPVLAMFSIGAGSYFEARMAIRDNAREIQDIRELFDRFVTLDRERHDFGPDGFRNSQISAGLEASIRRVLSERGVKEREFWEMLFQLNPHLVRPAGK